MADKISDKMVGTSEGCTCTATVADPLIKGGQRQNKNILQSAGKELSEENCNCNDQRKMIQQSENKDEKD